MFFHPPKRILGALMGLTMVATACGGGQGGIVDAGGSTSSAPAPPSETAREAADEPAAPAAENQLPNVDVVDIATGDSVNLQSFAPSDTPIVLWFWAPH